MQNREPRVEFQMVSTIADGNMLFEGMVSNISRNGLKVVDLPTKCRMKAKEYKAVISAKGRNYRLSLYPVWMEKNGMHIEVGFKIVTPTADWYLLLKELDPPERDIWGFRD